MSSEIWFKQNKGVTLILVIVLLGTLFMVGAAVLNSFREEVGFSRRQSDSAIAAAAADAGIEHAEYKIMQIEPISIPTSTYECSNNNCYIDRVELDKGWYQVDVPEYSTSSTSTYSIIKSVGGYMGVQRSFELKFYKKKTQP